MVSLLCTVRGCGAALRRSPSVLTCPQGHAFDVARSGYVNLLQPQDRRSKNPGDSKAAALARRRWTEAGYEGWQLEQILLEVGPDSSGRSIAALDIGCGEGFLLGSLARTRIVEGFGIDISIPAIELAARRYPEATWIVGNADRVLPFADGTFDLVTSITARRNGREMRRVLSPSGKVVVVVPGEDDAIELRQALLGRGDRRDRAAPAIEALRADFDLISRRTVAHAAVLDPAAVSDLLATTYRGARFRERGRASAMGAMKVTLSRKVLVFRPRS